MEIRNCPTVRPSAQEFSNFYQFVHKLDKIYKKDYGMVKVIPPEEWVSKAKDYQNRLEHLILKKPIEQNAQGKGGVFQSKNIIQNKMTFKSYKKYAMQESNKCANKTVEQKQKLVNKRIIQFWKTLAYSPPIYAADIPATLMDEDSGSWNLNNLNSILKHSFSEKIKGVNESYCYIGSWKSFFSWHKQDLDLAALNFIHQGQSKVWYSIAESDFWMLEQIAKKYFKAQHQSCNQFMRHKTFLIHPQILLKTYPEIKLTKMIHNQREFMLVFGGAYHCGFNCGFNIAQAVNYATTDWFNNLINIKCCTCTKKSVRAELESILYNLQNNQIFNDINTLESFQSLQFMVQENQMLQEIQVQVQMKKDKSQEVCKISIPKDDIIREKSMIYISEVKQKVTKYRKIDSDYEVQQDILKTKNKQKSIKKQEKTAKNKNKMNKKQCQRIVQNKQNMKQINNKLIQLVVTPSKCQISSKQSQLVSSIQL